VNTDSEPGLAGDATKPQRSSVWRWASRVIVGVGIVWVTVLLFRDVEVLRANFQIASVGWLAFTFLAGIVALLLNIPVFRIVLGAHSSLDIRYAYAARMLFVAQMLRHLPGRVWGIVYLVAETRPNIPAAAMVRANFDVMMYAMYFALLVAASLSVGAFTRIPYGIAIGVAGILCLAAVVRFDWLGRIAGFIVRAVPGRAARLADTIPLQRSMPWRTVVTIIGCNCLSWICYLAIWWAFTRIFPALEDVNIWLLCASYSAAWFIGYVAMITPAGLGIREAGFFALAGTLTTLPNLAFLAVFVRLWQIVTEMLVFLMFAFVKPTIVADNSAATVKSS
jgi:uncharacterized membrane protein YbhN (UPF0104 family)